MAGALSSGAAAAGEVAMSRAAAGPRRRRPARQRGAVAYVVLVFAFLFAPLVVVVGFSFNAIPRMALPITEVSLRWYQSVFSDPQVIQAITRSALAGIATAVVAGPLGIAAALGLNGLSARTRSVLLSAVLIPIMVPGLLLAIALALYYRELLHVGYSLPAAVAGHVLIALPFVILTMTAAVSGFRFSMLEAARDLGATRWQAFRTVTLPILRPAVLGAMLLSIAISVDEFIVSFFVAGRETTLPMLIWSRVVRGVDPSLNALATILLVVTSVLALLASRRTTVSV
jgi:spermidine/putrescine transport system permease protein